MPFDPNKLELLKSGGVGVSEPQEKIQFDNEKFQALKSEQKPSLIKESLQETSRQLQDLLTMPSRILGLPHPPMVSKLATETTPYLLQKATTPLGTFTIPTLSLRNIKSVFSGKGITETADIEPTALDVAWYAALIGYPAFQNVISRQQWNSVIDKLIQTERFKGAIMENMPAIEQYMSTAGIRMKPGLSTEQKVDIIISQAQKSPTFADVLIGLERGKIKPKTPIPTPIVEAEAVKPAPTPAPSEITPTAIAPKEVIPPKITPPPIQPSTIKTIPIKQEMPPVEEIKTSAETMPSVSPPAEEIKPPAKPYIGLTPGSKEWMQIWKTHPELYREMGIPLLLKPLAEEAKKYKSAKEFEDAFVLRKLWNFVPINTLEHKVARELIDIQAGRLKESPVTVFNRALRKSTPFNSIKDFWNKVAGEEAKIPTYKTKIQPELQSLVKEAKKYKTVEEFIKRGAKNLEISFEREKPSSPIFEKAFNTLSKKEQEFLFTRMPSRRVYDRWFRKTAIENMVINPEATLIMKGKPTTKLLEEGEKIPYINVSHHNIPLSDIEFKYYQAIKSQLTDIWNKAHLGEVKPIEPSKKSEVLPIEETKPLPKEKIFTSTITTGSGETPHAGDWQILSETPKTLKIKLIKLPDKIYGELDGYNTEKGKVITIKKDRWGFQKFEDGSFQFYPEKMGTPLYFEPVTPVKEVKLTKFNPQKFQEVKKQPTREEAEEDLEQIMFEKGIADYLEGEPGNIYSIIKSEGGIAPYKKRLSGQLKEEYREDVPIFLRNKKGLPLDEMAYALRERYPHLGITTEAELLDASKI